MAEAITATNIDAALVRLRSIVDQCDDLNGQLATLKTERDAIERGLIGFSEQSGLTAFATEGMGITIREKLRAKYDPEKWDELMKWAAANDKTYLIQRRLSDTKVVELVENGEPLPDGLSLEPFSTVSYRRK